ncbi:uvrD_C_2 domain-containing protein [Trichonephila clavipes]|nr:uvrD_C_2 domain-containing protein [Trichonephila clavipes]
MDFEAMNENGCFTFIWMIENFSYSWQKNGECISSPVFIVDTMGKTKCRLEIYPKEDTGVTKDFISFYLIRDEDCKCPEKIDIIYDLSFLATDVSVLVTNDTLKKSFLEWQERDENGDIIRIWLKFPKSCGRKQATKLRNLSARLNLDDDAVPITSQTSSVALNNNKTIIAKRKHFPLVSALAMTIHKSQGGTYDAIVYEYDRKHPRELVYVALSRVTKIEGLFMVTKEKY